MQSWLLRLCLSLVCLGALAVPSVDAAPQTTSAVVPSDEGLRTFGYSLVQTTPSVQYTPVLFEGPYFYFQLTNTGTQSDTYRMSVTNLTNIQFFGQVCIEQVCFPDSTTVTLAPAQSKLVGVNLIPFEDGECTADFDLASVGNPLLTSFAAVTLFAGQGLDAPAVARVEDFQLQSVSPNPVRGGASISFSLPTVNEANLALYDVAGRHVRTLFSGLKSAGVHSVTWDGRDSAGIPVASGVYLIRLSSAERSVSKTVSVLK